MASSTPVPSQSPSDCASSFTTTSVAEAVDVYAERKKKIHQAAILSAHGMLLRNADFALLVQCNLMDELLQAVKDHDAIYTPWRCKPNASQSQPETVNNEKTGVCEGEEESEDDAEADEDYYFDLTNDDDDDDDEDEDDEENNSNTETEQEHPQRSTMPKETEEPNIIYTDVATQTSNDPVQMLLDPKVSALQEAEPDCASINKSFYNFE